MVMKIINPQDVQEWFGYFFLLTMEILCFVDLSRTVGSFCRRQTAETLQKVA